MSAPVTLITGTPGAGKTLFAIDDTRKRAQEEKREVYYSGIADLMLPWVLIEHPESWYSAPDGAIIVIDECQRLFRPRGAGAQVPPFVAALETLRHRGHDIVLITQHPMLVDSNVRRLVGRHVHVSRRFGTHNATVLEFPSVREQPTKAAADAVRKAWRYPKEVFALYKSAELHTIKRSIPAKAWLLLILPVLIVGLFAWEYKRVKGRVEAPAEVVPTREAVGRVVPVSGVSRVDGSRRELSPDAWRNERVPRVPDLPWSAPRYDEVTKPMTAPYVAGCYTRGTACKCFSQQATFLIVGEDFCRRFVRYGAFQDWQVADGRRGVEAEAPKREAGPAVDGRYAEEASKGGEDAAPNLAVRWDGRQTPRRDY